MMKLKVDDLAMAAMAMAIREWEGCDGKDCTKMCEVFSETSPDWVCGYQTTKYLNTIFPALQAQIDSAILSERESATKAERERCALIAFEGSFPIDISVWLKSTKKEMTAITAEAIAAAIRKGDGAVEVKQSDADAILCVEAFTLSIRPSPIADAIINIIDGCEDGASGSEIIADLMKDERFSGPVGRNHSSAYNVLARLVDSGQVQKRDRLYYPIHVVMPDGGQELPLDGPQQEIGLEANASSPINSLEEGDQTGTV